MTVACPMYTGSMSFMLEEFSDFPVYICLSSTKGLQCLRIIKNRWCFDSDSIYLLAEEAEIACKK